MRALDDGIHTNRDIFRLNFCFYNTGNPDSDSSCTDDCSDYNFYNIARSDYTFYNIAHSNYNFRDCGFVILNRATPTG